MVHNCDGLCSNRQDQVVANPAHTVDVSYTHGQVQRLVRRDEA